MPSLIRCRSSCRGNASRLEPSRPLLPKAIALIRKRFMHVALPVSLVQVTLGGALVAVVGVLVGHA